MIRPLQIAAACNSCNPCATKNACNPCNPCNPCGAAKVNPYAVKRPAGMALRLSNDPAVLAEGKRLWNDKSLSTNGLACQTCHVNYAALKHLGLWEESYAPPDRGPPEKEITFDPSYSQLM